MDIRTALETLEISEANTDEEALKAYKDLIRVWHPDNFASKPDLLERATAKTKRLNEAWALLNDLRLGALVPQQQTARKVAPKVTPPYAWLLAGGAVVVVCLLLAWADAADVFSPELRLEKALTEHAYKTNRGLPLVLDDETELTAVFAGPGKRFTYVYRVLNYDKDNVGPSYFTALRESLKTNFLANAQKDESFKFFFENNVTLNYSFKDKSGADIVTLALTPETYKAP